MSLRLFIVVPIVPILAFVGAASCGGGGGFPVDASGPPAPGTVTLAWSLTDLAGAPITCAQVGANTIALTLQGHTTAGALVSLSCDQGTGTSQSLSPDTYDVSIELHGAGLTAVKVAAQNNVIVKPGANVALSPVVFPVDPHGAIVFSIKVPQADTNCGGAADQGAGITSTTITLQHDDSGPCEPVTFTHTKGATMLASYTVDCSSPMVANCIERDEALTATGLPSGGYTVHVVGKINAAACWRNDDTVQVPPQGSTQSGTWNLALQKAVAGCPAQAPNP
jgi:hypothetical protein